MFPNIRKQKYPICPKSQTSEQVKCFFSISTKQYVFCKNTRFPKGRKMPRVVWHWRCCRNHADDYRGKAAEREPWEVWIWPMGEISACSPWGSSKSPVQNCTCEPVLESYMHVCICTHLPPPSDIWNVYNEHLKI